MALIRTRLILPSGDNCKEDRHPSGISPLIPPGTDLRSGSVLGSMSIVKQQWRSSGLSLSFHPGSNCKEDRHPSGISPHGWTPCTWCLLSRMGMNTCEEGTLRSPVRDIFRIKCCTPVTFPLCFERWGLAPCVPAAVSS